MGNHEIINAKISAAILAEYNANGGDVAKAIDAVLAAGTYAKIVDELYDALNAKAA